MTINLTSEQRKWLEAEVAAGHFASVEDAVRFAIDHLFTPLDTDDLSWAKPYLDEARAEIARGNYLTLEEFNAHVGKRLKEMG